METVEQTATIVDKARAYAIDIFQNAPQGYVYHNFKHTREVVNTIASIAIPWSRLLDK